jgi:hypothetical protein
MALISAPPSDKSIFQFPPSFPNGTVSDSWIAWFQEVRNNNFVFPTPAAGFALGWDALGNLVNVPNTGADQTAAWTAADAANMAALADTTLGAKGSALVGNNPALTYPPNTVGSALAARLIAGDLASTASGKGAALVGYLAPYTGAVATTQGELDDRRVSVFDFLTDAQRADVRARTAALDLSVPIAAAITAMKGSKKTLYWPAGIYYHASALTVDYAPQWEAEGVANWDASGEVSHGVVLKSGVTGVSYGLTIDPGAGPFAAGLYVRGFKFLGGAGATNGTLLHNVGNDGRFENCTWDGFSGPGLDCNYAQDVTFHGCSWFRCGVTAATYALTIRGGSNLLTFYRPRIENCVRGLHLTGACFGINFDQPHFEMGDYGGANTYNDFYTAPPFLIDATGGISNGVKFSDGWFVPASVQTLMDHYSITADATAFLISSTDCEDLQFNGCTFIHGSKGGKFLQIVSTQRDYMARVVNCDFLRTDCRVAAIDMQEGVFENNTIHVYDNTSTAIFKVARFSYCLVNGNKVNSSNAGSTTKTSGYIFEAYTDALVFNKRSLLGLNAYIMDSYYKYANSLWACSPESQCPVKGLGVTPVAGAIDLELYRDGSILQPGTNTITSITNAKQGQVVKIMGVSGGTPTINNTASVILKGAANAGPLAANQILTLQEIDGDGKLYEIGRNF